MPNPWCYCRQRLPCKWLSGAWKQTSMLECFQLEWLSEELLYQSPRGNSVFLLHCCLHKQHTHTEHTLIAVGRCQSDRAAVSNAAIQFTSSIHLHCQLVKCGSSGKRQRILSALSSLSGLGGDWTLIGAGWDLDHSTANSFLIQTEVLQGVMGRGREMSLLRLPNWKRG